MNKIVFRDISSFGGGGEYLKLDHQSTTPIYMQIAEWIEIEILKGNFIEDEKVYSQYKLAEVFHINPATAAKGLTLLGQEGILYDKRGLGKFVSTNAKEIIKQKRKNQMMGELIETLIKEATYLGMTERELIEMIKNVHKKMGGGLR